MRLRARPARKPRTPLSAFFPLKAGAGWNYHAGQVDELREGLAPDVPANLQRTGIGSVYLDGQRFEGLMSGGECEAYLISDEQILVRGGADPEGRAARVLLSAPATVGTQWETGRAGDRPSVSRIAGEDEVATPAGTFQCLRVEAVSSGGALTASWYAPGVGLVQQYTSADDQMMLLHSFFIPPDDLTGSVYVQAVGAGELEILLGGLRTGLYGQARLDGLILGSHEIGAARGSLRVVCRVPVGVPEQAPTVRIVVPPAEEVRPGGLRPFVNRIVRRGGALWLCTHGYGVWVHEPGRWLDSWYSLNPHNSAVDDYVTDVAFPAPDVALFGTRGRGVVVQRREGQRVISEPLFEQSREASEAFVTALALSDGWLYVGTEDQGLLRCRPHGAELEGVELPSRTVLCVASLAEGVLVGAEGATYMVRGSEASEVRALQGRTVLAVCQAESAEVLLGLRDGGLLRWDLADGLNAIDADFLIGAHDSVFHITRDGNRTLYLSTSRGLVETPADGPARLLQVEGAEGALCCLPDGADLWVATRPGIWRIEKEQPPSPAPGKR
jgi:hypothetical protein